jgi:hypothetical protein
MADWQAIRAQALAVRLAKARSSADPDDISARIDLIGVPG